MDSTTKLGLPLVAAAQAQKHVTVNEALTRLDAAFQLSVASATTSTPPTIFQEGDAYLVPVGGVNAWDGQDGYLAFAVNGGWDFLSPVVGWQIWVSDQALRLTFDGSDWLENVLASSPAGAAMRAEVVEIDHTLLGGAAQEQTSYVIPGQCSVFAVTGRVLTAITGTLSDWSLGVDSSETRYGSGLGLGTGSWLRGLTGQPVTYYNATQLKLTANGGDFAGGEVRLAVHLLRFELPSG